MNWRRGLLRLWILVTLAWVAVVGVIYAPQFSDPRIPPVRMMYDATVKSMLPAIGAPDMPGYYAVEAPNQITFFFPDETPTDEAEKLLPLHFKYIDRSEEIWRARERLILPTLLLIAIPSALLFAFGGLVLWTLSGFRRDKPAGINE